MSTFGSLIKNHLNFHDFNFDSRLLEGILSMGYDKPTPIQEMAVPAILTNKDLIACAQTGTGKTAAYVLPVMQKILVSDRKHVNTLVLAPTRELAQQIDQQVEAFGYFTGISSMPVYGGGDGITWEQQKKAIREGIDIVIATPGRLISHMASGDLKMEHLQHLILDEADRMLDMGFYDDILRIIGYLPKKRQTLLFSATMPPKIRTLANKILDNPDQISIAISKPAEGINQQAYLVHNEQKLELLSTILQSGSFNSILIFASTKENVKKLDATLRRTGFSCKAFHSDLIQSEREEIMREFKNNMLPVLIGTDVLSRGIDVEGIDLVVNYDVPPDPEDYVHRIGRTARAERTGTAVTFINAADQGKFSRIEQLIGRSIEKLPNPTGIAAGVAYDPSKNKQPSNFKRRPPGKKSFRNSTKN